MRTIFYSLFLLFLGACEGEKQDQAPERVDQLTYEETQVSDTYVTRDTHADYDDTDDTKPEVDSKTQTASEPEDPDSMVSASPSQPSINFTHAPSIEFGDKLQLAIIENEPVDSINFFSDRECNNPLRSDDTVRHIAEEENIWNTNIIIGSAGILTLYALATKDDNDFCISVGTVNVKCETLSGNGSKEFPYAICNAEHLALMAGDKHYVLAQDVKIASEWEPIIEPFYGTLNGQKHAIIGLNKPLFKKLGVNSPDLKEQKTAIIKNLVLGEEYNSTVTLKNSEVGILAKKIFSAELKRIINHYPITAENKEKVGSLAGIVDGHLEAEYLENNGVIQAKSDIGGFFGEITPGSDIKLSKLKNNADITASNSRVGAIAGAVLKSDFKIQIDNSYNRGNIEGDYSAAGFIGKSDSKIQLMDSRNDGNIYIRYAISGGFIGGTSKAVEITNSINTGTIIGDNTNKSRTNRIGGMIGTLETTGKSEILESIKILDSINKGSIKANSGTSTNAGIIGLLSGGDLKIYKTQNLGSVTPNDVNNDAFVGKISDSIVTIDGFINTGEAPRLLGSLPKNSTIEYAINYREATKNCEACYLLSEEEDKLKLCKGDTCNEIDSFLTTSMKINWEEAPQTFTTWLTPGANQIHKDSDNAIIKAWEISEEDGWKKHEAASNSIGEFTADWLNSGTSLKNTGALNFVPKVIINTAYISYTHSQKLPGFKLVWAWDDEDENFPWSNVSPLEEETSMTHSDQLAPFIDPVE